jgi:hypothetical protein
MNRLRSKPPIAAFERLAAAFHHPADFLTYGFLLQRA